MQCLCNGRVSVCLSRQSAFAACHSTYGQQISIDSCWRRVPDAVARAVAVGSVMLGANLRGSKLTCLQCVWIRRAVCPTGGGVLRVH